MTKPAKAQFSSLYISSSFQTIVGENIYSEKFFRGLPLAGKMTINENKRSRKLGNIGGCKYWEYPGIPYSKK